MCVCVCVRQRMELSLIRCARYKCYLLLLFIYKYLMTVRQTDKQSDRLEGDVHVLQQTIILLVAQLSIL